MNATTRRDADGETIGVVGIAQDITLQNAQSVAIRRANEEFRVLIETANAPIIGVDTEIRVTDWNGKVASLTGYAKEDTAGRPLLEFIDAEFRTSVQDVLQKALRGEETANYNLKLTTKGGKRLVLCVVYS